MQIRNRWKNQTAKRKDNEPDNIIRQYKERLEGVIKRKWTPQQDQALLECYPRYQHAKYKWSDIRKDVLPM